MSVSVSVCVCVRARACACGCGCGWGAEVLARSPSSAYSSCFLGVFVLLC